MNSINPMELILKKLEELACDLMNAAVWYKHIIENKSFSILIPRKEYIYHVHLFY